MIISMNINLKNKQTEKKRNIDIILVLYIQM